MVVLYTRLFFQLLDELSSVMSSKLQTTTSPAESTGLSPSLVRRLPLNCVDCKKSGLVAIVKKYKVARFSNL